MSTTTSTSKAPPTASSPTKTYLTALNFLNSLLWFIILIKTIKINLRISRSVPTTNNIPPYTLVYDHIGQFTKWTQSLILLDVWNTLFGIVRTSLLAVLFQAASRLFLVWGIAENFSVPRESVWYSSMLVSWGIAEVTRFMYHVYAAGERGVDGVPAWLVWARYNFFYVLYITGAGSEWMCMYKSLPEAKQLGDIYYFAILASLVIWPLAFPNQYGHMIAQRRKMMRGKKKQR